MAGPGGAIAPDGRPAVAPGVGKNARRHDLEAPATPGLSNSDLQQGDVQRLEQAQKIAPRPKQRQGAAAPKPKPQRGKAPATQGGMEIPDPIQFAAGKIGGNPADMNPHPGRQVDPSPWVPLLREMALRPNSGGALPVHLQNMLTQYVRRPIVPNAHFIDFNELDETIARSL